MAESLNTNISIQLNSSITKTINRFFHDNFSIAPSDYKYGRKTLVGGEENVLLASQFNYIFFIGENCVDYQVGDVGTARRGKLFFHVGDKIDLYVSNTSNGTIDLEYVCANIL